MSVARSALAAVEVTVAVVGIAVTVSRHPLFRAAVRSAPPAMRNAAADAVLDAAYQAGVVARRLVPRRLATSTPWATVIDPIARVALRGVRTRGTAGNERREWYGATDLHSLTALRGTYDGVDLGDLAPIDPPVRFGFASVPPRPSVTAVVTTIERRAAGSARQQIGERRDQ